MNLRLEGLLYNELEERYMIVYWLKELKGLQVVRQNQQGESLEEHAFKNP